MGFSESFQSNPFALAGLSILSGQSVSDALKEGAVLSNAFIKQQQEKVEQQRLLAMQQQLPGLLDSVDTNDPQGAVKTLVSAGVPIDSALKLVGEVSKIQNQNQKMQITNQLFGGGAGGMGGGGGQDPYSLMQAGVVTGNPSLVQYGQALLGQQEKERNFGSGREDETFKRAQTLSDDFVRDSKTYLDTKTSYQSMLDAAYDPSGAGDITMVYSFMKMLDPTSVVREGEAATAEQAGGVPATVRNAYNRLLTGEKLSPKVREDYLKQAEIRFKRQAQGQKARIGQYTKKANSFGVSPDMVITDYGAPVAPGQEEATAPQQPDMSLPGANNPGMTAAESAAQGVPSFSDEQIPTGGSVVPKPLAIKTINGKTYIKTSQGWFEQ